MKEARDSSLDIAKGIGILLVVIGHLHELPLLLVKFIYSFHMPFFFILSGYLYNITKYSSLSLYEYIRSKWRKLIIPYFAMALSCYFIFIILPNLFLIISGRTESLLSFDKPLLGILYSKGSIDWLPNCSPLWFLTCIFVTQIIFFVIIKNLKGYRKIFIYCASCAVLGYLTTRFVPVKLPWNLDTALTAVFLFCLGNLSCRYKIINLIKKKAFTFIPFLIICSSLCFYFNFGMVNMAANRYGNIILFYFGAISSTLIILFISSIGSRFPFFRFWGENTMPVIGFSYAAKTLASDLLPHNYYDVWYLSLAVQIVVLYLIILLIRQVDSANNLFYGFRTEISYRPLFALRKSSPGVRNMLHQ